MSYVDRNFILGSEHDNMQIKSIFVYLMKSFFTNNSNIDLDRAVTQEVPLILRTILILRSC